MIVEKVKNFISKNNLSGTFIVAFSGGYDSMCLLDILNKLNYDIVAVHLNHNWRGNESLLEAENCYEFCQKNNIKFYTETLDDNIEKNETAAREARYDFFKRCAKRFNSNIVFTAHNFDDNAETVLYRIIKRVSATICFISQRNCGSMMLLCSAATVMRSELICSAG